MADLVSNSIIDPRITSASLIDARYRDYVNNIRPVETALMDMNTYANPELLNKTLDAVPKDVQNAYRGTAIGQQSQVGDYGIKLDLRQKKSMATQRNLGTTASIVDAANRIRQRLLDRDTEMALGGSVAMAGGGGK